MRKILLGVVIGVMIALPAGAFAWSSRQAATPFKVAHCATIAETDEQNPNNCSVMVSKFQDGNINCYVAVQNQSLSHDYHDPSISCVKGN